MSKVFVSLGSNINSECNLVSAVRELARWCRLLDVSPVYETKPVGNVDQPRFLNAAVVIETELSPADLKANVLLHIEEMLGRVRTTDKNGPRVIDLDISLYDDRVLKLGQRQIPDPDILSFAHVAVPLADLAPLLNHPETGELLIDVAQRLTSDGLVRRFDVALWPTDFF